MLKVLGISINLIPAHISMHREPDTFSSKHVNITNQITLLMSLAEDADFFSSDEFKVPTILLNCISEKMADN